MSPMFPAATILEPAKSTIQTSFESWANSFTAAMWPWNSCPWAIPCRPFAPLEKWPSNSAIPARNVPGTVSQGGLMQRREMLRILTVGAALPALSPELFAFFRAAHPADGYLLRTLNPHQNDTVVAMSDRIIPETDTPGAKAA